MNWSKAIACAWAQPAETTGTLWGGLSQQQGGVQQGPALSQGWLLSLLAALSAWGLLSVTSLLRNSRRQAEMETPLSGPCWKA